jgi:hypothetical protein
MGLGKRGLHVSGEYEYERVRHGMVDGMGVVS